MILSKEVVNTLFMEFKQKNVTPSTVLGCRSSHGTSVYNNKLYVLGGEIVARTPVDSTLWSLALNSEEGKEVQWTSVETNTSDAPSPRIAHTQVIANDQLYIFGGRQGITMDESPLNDLWKFHFETSTWTLVETNETSNAPSPRSFHKMLSVGNNTLYVFGGCATVGRLNDLHKYDIASNTWTQLALAPDDLPGRGGAGFVANQDGTKLYVVGGFYGHESNGVWQYDVASNAWSTVLPEGNDQLRPFSVACGVTVENKLIFFGGEVNPSEKGHEGAGGFTDDVVILDGTTGLPIAAEMTSTVRPMARGWSDADIWNGHLVVYGGLSGSDEAPQRLEDVWLLKTC